MSNYVPRPGSKTEAAVDYLRANGGRALAVDIAEAVDTERKNLHALFTAAIAAGLMESCDLPGGPGYGLCSAAPAAAAAAPIKPAPAAAPQAPTKRRGRPPVAKPAKPPRALIAKEIQRRKAVKRPRTAPAPAPAPASSSFRCGFFSDGTLRLEGCDADMTAVGGGYGGINLSPGAAAVLTDFLARGKS